MGFKRKHSVREARCRLPKMQHEKIMGHLGKVTMGVGEHANCKRRLPKLGRPTLQNIGNIG